MDAKEGGMGGKGRLAAAVKLRRGVCGLDS